jgi:hypothetical protein
MTDDSEGGGPEISVLRVDRLQLAAWLRLHKQRVIARELLPAGRVVYYFASSIDVAQLVEAWSAQSQENGRLVSFARIVRHEIAIANRMRRERLFQERADRESGAADATESDGA